MNILMLAEVSAAAVLGGAERVLREQALSLSRRGHRLHLITRAPRGDSRSQVRITNDGEGIQEDRYHPSTQNELAFVLSSVRGSVHQVDAVSQRTAIDVGVIHQSLAGLGPVLRRRNRASGWVYVCHSLAHEEYLSRNLGGSLAVGYRIRRAINARLRRWCERVVIRRCHRVVVLSEFMKRRVMAHHAVAVERIRVIPGGADLARFCLPDDPVAVRRQLRLPLNKVILVTVRNLVPRMGLDQFLRAVALLGDEGRDVMVLIGGEGPLREDLQSLAGDLGVADRVRLLGYLPEEQLPHYYQAADLVLMPTHELEGFGLVTVEALACGTPVLGTPVGAIPEVLGKIDPDLIASATDSVALATAIRRLLCRFRDHPGEQERLSKQGRVVAETEYSWARHGEQLEEVLQEVSGEVKTSING